MIALHRRAPQRGVGLIEVMVALFVISVGVLSFAKTEGLALSETDIARRRSMAAFAADSLAAAMHANESFWQQTLTSTGAAPLTVAVTGSAVSNSLLASNTPTNNCTGTIPACSNQQVASYDVQRWAAQLSQLLPSDIATILCVQATATVPVTCTIQISWSEGAVSSITSTAYSATGNLPTYTLYVQP